MYFLESLFHRLGLTRAQIKDILGIKCIACLRCINLFLITDYFFVAFLHNVVHLYASFLFTKKCT